MRTVNYKGLPQVQSYTTCSALMIAASSGAAVIGSNVPGPRYPFFAVLPTVNPGELLVSDQSMDPSSEMGFNDVRLGNR